MKLHLRISVCCTGRGHCAWFGPQPALNRRGGLKIYFEHRALDRVRIIRMLQPGFELKPAYRNSDRTSLRSGSGGLLDAYY